MSIRNPLTAILLVLALAGPCSVLAEVKKGYYPSGKLKADWNYRESREERISKKSDVSGEWIILTYSENCNYFYHPRKVTFSDKGTISAYIKVVEYGSVLMEQRNEKVMSLIPMP